MPVEVRQLVPGDEHRLSDFLETRADSSMFLRSNLRVGGLVDQGRPYDATYVGAIEGGRVTAAAALNWNGMLALQAPYHLGPVLKALEAVASRPIGGLAGPYGQTVEARRLLGRAKAPVRKDSREDLFALPLDQLDVPEHLAGKAWISRRPRQGELDELIAWRLASTIETLAGEDGAEARAEADETIRRLDREAALRVLEVDGRPVSMSSYNARMPDMVQIGGVYTPPDLRGLGFARACVAGSLLAARRNGIARSVLFTPKTNASAQAAYRALGFRVVGEYGLLIFR